LEAKPQIFGREEGAAGEALLHLGGLGALWRLYEENGKFAEVFDLSTFVSNFLAIFFTAFLACIMQRRLADVAQITDSA
jgi:fluoride ion exporter CrcB/FEX